MEKARALLTFIQQDPYLNLTAAVMTLILVALAAHFFVKFVLRRAGYMVAPRLGALPAELVQDNILFNRLALFVPALIIYQTALVLPVIGPTVTAVIQKAAVVAAIIIGVGTITRTMTVANTVYCRYPVSRTRPIKGYLQVATIIIYAISFILIVATILDKSPLVFISGLGALTAVILLVFRDTLLSLVAGVQLTTNDLIRVGDWIEMPQFEADGDVVDIALHVVKVQNWDKTITVIPTHKFLEHSFKNWRAMSDAGGRRIKRAIYIDLNSVRFLSADEIQRFSTFALLKDYIERKQAELAKYNGEIKSESVLVSNARRLTNLGTFRAYLINYLRQHPLIHQEMTFLVRQLQPTSEGVPLEIYVFSKDTRWEVYENLQADIFDHVFAVIREFGLGVFQKPSGKDLLEAAKKSPDPILALSHQ